MATHQDDLDLLLSLQDRVLETPPASPSTHHSQSTDYLSDHGSPRQVRNSDMSVFKDVVRDYLESEPEIVDKAPKLNRSKHLHDVDVEKFSGLRIRDLLVSSAELSDHFSDIRFVRLPAIRNSLLGDTISGSWATVGVLTEKGNPKVSSTGKNYCIWKIGCLDEKTLSVFLFGDAYSRYCKEQVGTVFALFNCGVRKDNEGNGFSLSVFSAGQILKMGTSIDYGVCKGKRKDGMACTVVINKRRGIYCKYHTANASQKYSVTRSELKGGNLKTAFRNPLHAEGIYLVDPLTDAKNLRKAMQPVKVLSVDGLKKALSNAGKVTTNAHSQGIRFLTEVTGKMHPKDLRGGSATSNQQKDSTGKMSAMKLSSTTIIKDQPEAKRKKTEQPTEKMIELDLFSSDEEV
ncbi:zinc finger protein [Macleaya cordata]|uniref:Zinc finger protein n=1 Tax=Macleaya cordata TaxID=56857 RepID=A0A200RA44_MACCD|nr:zinc finger protein [Macleaya cordata]